MFDNNKEQTRRLETAKIKFLRPDEGYRTKDHTRNEDNRESWEIQPSIHNTLFVNNA